MIFIGTWLSKELISCNQELTVTGFKIRGIVTDNHPANVAAFNILLHDNEEDRKNYFILPNTDTNTYIFLDTVHLVQNIRNNLLDQKKFVFPGFNFASNEINISLPSGYITWNDIHFIYDRDQNFSGNLRKAHKLSYHALHPGNNKQNVNLALSIFDETTIAVSTCYLPGRPDISNFLKLIHT